MGPRIGIDFDNTIICYDGIFYRIARERGWIPPETAPTKDAVRDHLRQIGKEDDWTELQGQVYGEQIRTAAPYPGVIDFFRSCRFGNVPVAIISHKTRFPYRGRAHDLHQAAENWLAANGFFDPDGPGLSRDQVFFEPTKEAKIARIATRQCSHFIDDLPEFLSHRAFPKSVRQVLFDPKGRHPSAAQRERFTSWLAIADFFFPERAPLPHD